MAPELQSPRYKDAPGSPCPISTPVLGFGGVAGVMLHPKTCSWGVPGAPHAGWAGAVAAWLFCTEITQVWWARRALLARQVL